MKKEKTKKVEAEITKERILESNDPKEIGTALNNAIKDNPNKPSEEEIEEAKKKFEEEAKNFSIKTWVIGVLEERNDIYEYLIHFIKNRLFWTKNGWMGVIKLTEELKTSYEVANAQNDSIKLGYQAIEFLYYSLSNPGGIGLEAAQSFESEFNLFSKIFKYVEDELKAARAKLQEIQFLQDTWSAMSQGFYLEVEPEENNSIEKESKEEINH